MKLIVLALTITFFAYWVYTASASNWKSEASREWIHQTFDFSTGKKIGPQRVTKYDPWRCSGCHDVNKVRMGGIVSPQPGAVFVKEVMVPINLSVRR